MEHPLCRNVWTKYFTYFMSHLCLIPARLIWLSQFHRLGSRDLGDQILLKVVRTQWCLVAKPLPFPGFLLPPLLLLIGFSSYQGKELISARKVPIFKAASITWQSWNLPIRPTWACIPVASFTSFVAEPVSWPYCASWYFIIIKIRTTVSALQDNIMHNKLHILCNKYWWWF